VPLWAIPVTLIYAPCRVTCPECKSIHVESMPWAAGKKRLTKAFAVAIATWAKSLPWAPGCPSFPVFLVYDRRRRCLRGCLWPCP
jgi:hypothetical protein